ncbi:hypothetical protein [Arcanobacterium phocae]|uniref:hypothetical protein n=1 Tax=Arcanobacterium phocae TaxID=131112 RepID=UPI001C0E99B4|nr:hypothetical protein [Arcanobacterium phocae]
MSITASDLREMSESVFRALWDLVMAERDRRQIMANAPRELERLQTEVLVARDGIAKTPEKPDEAPVFVKPSTPVELYPKGWIVKNQQGQLVRSLVENNGTDPDEVGAQWEVMELVEENPLAPVDDATEWDGENHPYLEDDFVQYHGLVYRVVVAHYSTREKTPDLTPDLYELAHK